ncbi:hypothetical protein [Proteiniphilum sp.]|uniref:hypothetical protein n=1 Tax=Proteiniphilum sp. TaxID=1926877 RepID=UPI002B1F1212|nr:hypothetical protein [Proteiniphilum sp.]MEA4917773.1 hypothetical protein [Proteiniphilum sp.]
MKFRIFLAVLAMTFVFQSCQNQRRNESTEDSPRIVNIINFIRQTEPRIERITDEILYQTVVEQVKLLKEYQLKGTFLLQYDALINPRYQELLKNELLDGSEIGGWWEITQPHVEAAEIEWRGIYPWDWHADVGFSPGYTPEEREKLVDVYMEKFKLIFGEYPSSVGSWFIDAYTLGYMYDKYGIKASCNCRDQIGTDGYTLWGGYWGQAYYPSRINAYMPAQTETGQIPVPIFRMLGSDPSYQYDHGVGQGVSQSVTTLEPLCREAGGNPEWVKWFFNTMFDDPALGFTYVQAGQENSFTWDAMKDGLAIQIPLIAEQCKMNKIRVETLEESGAWFKENFKVTPPTAISSLSDYRPQNRKTVWYNSRFYRTNILWEGSSFKIRDIHVFNESVESDYYKNRLTSSQCYYTTLPIVDGNLWSNDNYLAGMKLYYVIGDGEWVEAKSSHSPLITKGEDWLSVAWTLENDIATLTMLFSEDKTEISCEANSKDFKWELNLTTAPNIDLPFTNLSEKEIDARLKNFDYQVKLDQGLLKDTRDSSSGSVFTLTPTGHKITIAYN